jgi:WD40 repeat protein
LLTSKNKKGTSEKLLYVCAKIVVILFEKLNEQKHYVEHENAISALAVSNSSLIASGEKGENPKIHIWDVHTLKTIHIFQGDHKSDVYLLEFIKDDTLLVTCSLRTNTPVVVYNVENRSIVFSYFAEELVRRIVPIFTEIQQFGEGKEVTHKYTDKNFFLFSKNQSVLIMQNDLHSNLSVQNMMKFKKLAEITAAVSFLTEAEDQRNEQEGEQEGYKDELVQATVVLLTGHIDGKVVKWDNLRPIKELTQYNSPIVEITLIKDIIIVATEDGILELRSIDFQQVYRKLDIKNFAYKLMSNSIKNLVITHSSIYFNTYGGDFIKLKLLVNETEGKGVSVTLRVKFANKGKKKEKYRNV